MFVDTFENWWFLLGIFLNFKFKIVMCKVNCMLQPNKITVGWRENIGKKFLLCDCGDSYNNNQTIWFDLLHFELFCCTQCTYVSTNSTFFNFSFTYDISYICIVYVYLYIGKYVFCVLSICANVYLLNEKYHETSTYFCASNSKMYETSKTKINRALKKLKIRKEAKEKKNEI